MKKLSSTYEDDFDIDSEDALGQRNRNYDMLIEEVKGVLTTRQHKLFKLRYYHKRGNEAGINVHYFRPPMRGDNVIKASTPLTPRERFELDEETRRRIIESVKKSIPDE